MPRGRLSGADFRTVMRSPALFARRYDTLAMQKVEGSSPFIRFETCSERSRSAISAAGIDGWAEANFELDRLTSDLLEDDDGSGVVG